MRRLFHPPPLHLFPFIVVLLALADRWFREGDAHHGRPFEAAGNGSIESIHVFGEETLADDPQTLDHLFTVGHNLCLSNGSGRLVLQREVAVLRANGGRAFGDMENVT